MAFSDNVWKTKKSRINTSERLKKNDILSQILITYYSLFIIIITIIDMKYDELNFEVLTLILSISILVISTFIFSRNYKERSLMIQTAYIKIGKIYRKVLEKENSNQDFSNLEEEYDDILGYTENHSSCDYMQVMYEVRNNKKYQDVNGNFGYADWISWLWCKIAKYLFVFLLIITPIIVFLVAIYN